MGQGRRTSEKGIQNMIKEWGRQSEKALVGHGIAGAYEPEVFFKDKTVASCGCDHHGAETSQNKHTDSIK